MTIVTRFPPSPTGKMHIGNMRTALFNYLYARHHGGKFLLRIEDTDRQRSTEENVQVIFDALEWMDLEHDNETVVRQFDNRDRHLEVAYELLKKGKAYKCYVSKEELAQKRDEAQVKGEHFKFVSPWRDKDPKDAPQDVDPVIRIKAPIDGESTVNDLVQGDVTVGNDQLDDFILVRADNTPTYMLSVVVDDHDMGVTHVIRGDDHLNNVFRQNIIYDGMEWQRPEYAHLPMIVGSDGKKLSKRHGAVGVAEFKDSGFLPEALENMLLRLGWAHGDEEIIPRERAIEVFDLDGVNKAPAQLNYQKLESLNQHYMQELDIEALFDKVQPFFDGDVDKEQALKLLPIVAERSKTLQELASGTAALLNSDVQYDEQAREVLNQDTTTPILSHVSETVISKKAKVETPDEVSDLFKSVMSEKDIKPKDFYHAIRASVCGTMSSPDITKVVSALGQDEFLARIKKATTV